jgi:putative transcriptional regulator
LIDITFSNSEALEKGKLLIAEPFLDEDYFRRAIIFLCENNNEGSFGFVINNFINIKLCDLDETFPDIETKISLGGPMEINSLYFLHKMGDKIQNSALVENGIYIGGDFQELTNLIKEDNSLMDEVRFFIGYSGWAADQLENEVKNNTWVVSEKNAKNILFESQAKQSWKRYLHELGGKYKIISTFPLDPNNN